MATAYLGLGSNLGDKKQNLTQALRLLSSRVKIMKMSSVYETEPVGYSEQPLFFNIVCQVSTTLSPQELLRFAKEIEYQMGRKASFRNAPRIIDIDMLFYDDQIIHTEELTVPHPHLTERAFVLVPFAEIGPGFVHPEKKKNIAQLLNNLEPVTGVQRLSETIDIGSKGRKSRCIRYQ